MPLQLRLRLLLDLCRFGRTPSLTLTLDSLWDLLSFVSERCSRWSLLWHQKGRVFYACMFNKQKVKHSRDGDDSRGWSLFIWGFSQQAIEWMLHNIHFSIIRKQTSDCHSFLSMSQWPAKNEKCFSVTCDGQFRGRWWWEVILSQKWTELDQVWCRKPRFRRRQGNQQLK